MVKNTNELSGKAMAVIVGAICLIAPWFAQLGLGSKLIISIIGLILIGLGVR